MLLLMPIQVALVFCFVVAFITMFHGAGGNIDSFAKLKVPLLINHRETIGALFTDKGFMLPSVIMKLLGSLQDLSTIIADKLFSFSSVYHFLVPSKRCSRIENLAAIFTHDTFIIIVTTSNNSNLLNSFI